MPPTARRLTIAAGAVAGLALLWAAQAPSPAPSKESSMSNVIHLTTPAFPALATQDKPVLIDFWAPWCGPCRIQGPIMDTVAGQVGDKAIVAKVNVDEEHELAATFGVQAIPTLVLVKQGKLVQRFVGVQQAPTLVQAVEAAH